ncbi:FAD-dependent oxidoreductase [Dysgonomonas sp. BGC7]|uniref:FAD-dependent oxidoreductase n=1 Tax=Dysgonomonas sp. BGC7 TaxID=1658008 RepID=UPI000681F904|nr:FAD-dependent oxidoreductase [Dysgonomonas sp. BGC7]MBD8388786.1 FAD-dependent oxidoreductase [Dysgonomonas sp. BGC7]
MKKIVILLLLLSVISHSSYASDYDLVIVGGNPAGITAAIAAAREGKNCVILERTEHIGGLPVNGLGATDIGTRGATTGLFEQFVALNKAYYIEKYGAQSVQVQDCSDGYHFEPHVAAKTFERMLRQTKSGKITILKLRQFDSEPRYVTKQGNRIHSIRILNRETGEEEFYTGKIFIDATYEGDLGAAAGIPFKLGREGAEEYSEPCAGKIYRWWKHGPDAEGTTYQGDNAIQAYNYRLCLTNEANIRKLISKPDNYNRLEYISLIDDVFTGRNTDIRFKEMDEAKIEENRKKVSRGERSSALGDIWGIAKLSSMTKLPNGKTDANNQHLALISTDLPEENWPWPTSGWEWRDRFAERLKSYTLGLLWFAQNDDALPAHFREACKQWGLAKDEYPDNDGFPRQVYVREGRRLEGIHFFTANDALPSAKGGRPPIHLSSITASHYALDSHAVRKREPERIHLDGFFSYPSAVYTVPYGVMVPQTIDNLLFPVAVSGSHVGFSTLRMEPCWMALGEAAGIAASIAIDNSGNVRNISPFSLQEKLLSNGATLIYFKDLKNTDPDFSLVQKLALKGFFPNWDARLDKPLDNITAALWKKLSGKEIDNIGKTRREVIHTLFKNLR